MNSRLSVWIAWAAIAASVAYLAWTANYPAEAETEAEPDSAATWADVRSDLALLELQSRMVIGISQFSPQEAAATLQQLEDMALSDHGRIAAAIVYSFVDSADGADAAAEILDGIAAEEAELVGQVRSGLTQGVDEVQRESLESELGWFAQLVPPSTPDDAFGDAIRSQAAVSMVVIMLVFFGLCLALVTGLVLLILLFVKRSSGQVVFRYDREQGAERKHLFLEAFAVYLSVMALGSWASEFVPELSMAAYAISFLLALFWPCIRGCGWRETCRLMGWTRGRGWLREVWAGILGYLGLLVFAVAGLILAMILMGVYNLLGPDSGSADMADSSHPIVGMLTGSGGWIERLVLLFFAAAIAPFLEETMFRGSLFRYLRHGWGLIISSIVGGFIFAVIHPQGWFAVPALCSMGIGFALLREWRDSLVASMTAHALNNGMIVIIVLILLGS